MRFVEDVRLSGTRTTADGYLTADVRCARTGIQKYAGSELDKPEMSTVNVYRPENTVFSKDSLGTFVGKPVTDDHPTEPVTADNWKQHAVGHIGEDVLRDGEFIRVPIVLMDADVIAKVKSGKREISMGYSMDLRWEDGVAPDGTPYQAVMDNLKMNHLAIVDVARAGPECRVGDNASKWGTAPIHTTDETKEPPMSSDKLQTVVVDGIPVDTTDAGAATIKKLLDDKKVFEDLLADEEKAHKEALDAKDKELAAKDAEISELKDKQLDDAAIDKRVNDRAKLIGDASKLASDTDFSGMSDADIRKAAVVAARGEDAVADKSDAYISAAFDLALEAADDKPANDPVRAALKTQDKKPTDQDNGQDAYEQRIADGWKQKQEA